MIEPALFTGADGQDLLRVYVRDECGTETAHNIEVSVNCLAALASDASDRVRRYLRGDGR